MIDKDFIALLIAIFLIGFVITTSAVIYDYINYKKRSGGRYQPSNLPYNFFFYIGCLLLISALAIPAFILLVEFIKGLL